MPQAKGNTPYKVFYSDNCQSTIKNMQNFLRNEDILEKQRKIIKKDKKYTKIASWRGGLDVNFFFFIAVYYRLIQKHHYKALQKKLTLLNKQRN